MADPLSGASADSVGFIMSEAIVPVEETDGSPGIRLPASGSGEAEGVGVAEVLARSRDALVGVSVWLGRLMLLLMALLTELLMLLALRVAVVEAVGRALVLVVTLGAALVCWLGCCGAGAGALAGGVGETPKPGIDRVVTPGWMRRIGAGTGAGSWMGTFVCLRPRTAISSSTVRGGRISNSLVRVMP